MKKKPFIVKNKNVLRGTRLAYNAGVQERYTKSINMLVSRMTKTTTREIERLFKGEIAESFFESQAAKIALDDSSLFDKDFDLGDLPSGSKKKYESKSIASKSRILLNSLKRRFDQLFDDEVPVIVEKMLKTTEKHSKSSINASLNKMTPENFTLKSGLIKANEKEVYKALIESNVSQFKLIPNTYFNEVTNAVMTSISTGKGLPDLMPTIKAGYLQNKDLDKYKEKGINFYNKKIERKTHLAALDQTRKAFSYINKQKLTNIGVKRLEWNHSYGGLHPRRSHIKIDSHIFSFENLESEQAALGVPEADRGLPGEPINCRCTYGPVIDFDELE